MKRFRIVAGGIALACAPICMTGAFADAAHDAVTYQIDIAHSGRGTLTGFKGKLKQLWTKNLGTGAISYPLIAGGLVFVTAADTGNYGTELFALNATTGATVWRQLIGGTYYWSNAAYENGVVFVVNYDGVASAFDAASGTPAWSVQMQGQGAFSSPPAAQNGLLFLAGAGEGGTLYAVDESSGNVQWTVPVENGDNSSPVLGADGVYVTYPCQYYKFAPTNGALLWHDDEGCEGGGGRTAVWYDAQLFVRDTAVPNSILNAKTGASVGSFAAQPAPTLYSHKKQTYIVALANGTLSSVDEATGATAWSFAGDGALTTAPLAIGRWIVEGSGSGNLYVLDETNGRVVWWGNVGASIPAPDEQDVSQPLTGLGAAGGVLIVPAGTQISAYAPK